jgi:hypothetical protein
MGDVIIKIDGQDREIAFDLEVVTIAEYVKFAGGILPTEGDFTLLAKVSGLTVDAIKNLSQPAYRKLVRAYFKAANSTDPN